MSDGCGTMRPDCRERFRSQDQSDAERDAALRSLAERIEMVPDRVVARINEALGPQTRRNQDDIEKLFDLIGDLQQRQAETQAEIRELAGQARGAGGLLRVGIPVVITLVSAGVAFGGVTAFLN